MWQIEWMTSREASKLTAQARIFAGRGLQLAVRSVLSKVRKNAGVKTNLRPFLRYLRRQLIHSDKFY
jgi:hypothetical protein